MSGNTLNGQAPKPKSLATVTHFAKVSRQVVLRRMAPDQCFSSRVFWALVLWSWCGPDTSQDGAVVQKNPKGYFPRDEKNQPIYIPAQQKDILQLLKLNQGLKGKLSKTITRLIESGQVLTDEAGRMYVHADPPAFEEADSVACTGNWKIADHTVRREDLPSDPVACTEAIRWLNELSTAWKSELNSLRIGYRKSLVQGLFERGIIIDKKRQISREEPSSSAFSTVVEDEPPEEKAEEEDCSYQSFKSQYPPDHFDEAKTKHSYEGLKPAEKRRCLERLKIYLESDRWKADSGRWIPLSSNWIKAYDTDPPPVLKRHTAIGADGDEEFFKWQRESHQEISELLRRSTGKPRNESPPNS